MAKEEKKDGRKMTYDELLKAAQDLSAQNRYFKEQTELMQKKIVELSNFAMFKRIDYLFEVVKNSEKFPVEFVQKSVTEIVETMTPNEEAPEEKEVKEHDAE